MHLCANSTHGLYQQSVCAWNSALLCIILASHSPNAQTMNSCLNSIYMIAPWLAGGDSAYQIIQCVCFMLQRNISHFLDTISSENFHTCQPYQKTASLFLFVIIA